MPIYLVERYLPGMSPALVAATARDARRAAERTGDAATVRYLQSTFVPQDETCFCLFEAGSVVAVAEANEAQGLPYERIVEAVHVRADDVTPAGRPGREGPSDDRGAPRRSPTQPERSGGAPPCL